LNAFVSFVADVRHLPFQEPAAASATGFQQLFGLDALHRALVESGRMGCNVIGGGLAFV
jgi:hypothetical protein